jgi:precorrin-3B synthase
VPADASVERTRPDACPGALDVHPAADGGLARVRVPGGTLTNARFRALITAAAELGDGSVELTSRANAQIRGLADGAQFALARRLADAGLLPSLEHERVRNVIASPLGDTQRTVDEIDRLLRADPVLAGLPGRFLITVDDGTGDVSGLRGDVGLHRVDATTSALLLAGRDTGLRVEDGPAAVIAAARAFAELRGTAWRLAELPGGVAAITARLGVPGAERLTPPVAQPPAPGPHGDLLVVGVPLGRLDQRHAHALAALGTTVRLTPWRSVVVPRTDADLGDLVTDPASPWHGVTACTGRPGCAKSLSDVRADAADWVRAGSRTDDLPVHWAGCERRCGRPTGPVVDVVATSDGYDVRRDQ